MNPIAIEEYNPVWPEQFMAIRRELEAALEGLFAAIEHVGSTSVPGLSAKPVIDIDVLLQTADDLPDVTRRLGPLGYRPQGNFGIDGREAFQTPPDIYPHHLYVCLPGSPEYHRHLAFRNHLRTHPSVAIDYANLKRELAAKYGADRDEYARGKSHFVIEVLLLIQGDGPP